MRTNQQLGFLEEFETSRPSNPLFCHQEFLEKWASMAGMHLGRRAAFLMLRPSVDARRLHYKATAGINRGWRRHGSVAARAVTFTPGGLKNALRRKSRASFPTTPTVAVFLRDIRHHDDHSRLTPDRSIPTTCR